MPIVAWVAAATVGVGTARVFPAQVPATAPETRVGVPMAGARMVRDVTVIDGDAQITVSRTSGMPVVLSVETSTGKFVLAGDSSTLAEWVDSADASPAPAMASKKNRPVWRSWLLRAQRDTATSMSLTRVWSTAGSNMELRASNGAWGTFELLEPDSRSSSRLRRSAICARWGARPSICPTDGRSVGKPDASRARVVLNAVPRGRLML